MSEIPVPDRPVGDVEADPKRPYKAIAGAIVTLIGLLWAALEGRRDDLGNMTLSEWLSVIVPTILAFAAVYGVRNPKVVDTHDERGSAAAWYGLAVGAAVVVLITLFTLGVMSAMIVGALLAVGGFALHEALDDRRRDLSEAGEVAWVPLIIGAVAVVVLLLFLDAVGVISMGGGR